MDRGGEKEASKLCVCVCVHDTAYTLHQGIYEDTQQNSNALERNPLPTPTTYNL